MTIVRVARRLAPESLKTRKTRKKLQKHWDDVEKKITPESLREKIDEIHRWIARHAQYRVPLRDKKFSLFDENQNAARTSQRVTAVARKLQEEIQRMVSAIQPAEPVS